LKSTVVLVCQSDTILDLGILSGLNAARGWILIQLVPDDIAVLLKAIKLKQPDVVILSQRSNSARHSQFRSLLASLPTIRTLIVCMESNHVCINQSQIIQIEKASDLINLLQTTSQMNLPGGKISMEQDQDHEQRKQLSKLNLKANSKEENL
jgi:hypothetical protein